MFPLWWYCKVISMQDDCISNLNCHHAPMLCSHVRLHDYRDRDKVRPLDESRCAGKCARCREIATPRSHLQPSTPTSVRVVQCQSSHTTQVLHAPTSCSLRTCQVSPSNLSPLCADNHHQQLYQPGPQLPSCTLLFLALPTERFGSIRSSHREDKQML